MSGISRDEWLAALGASAQPCDQDAVTVVELAAMLNVGRMAAYRHILALLKTGQATPTRKQITGPSGIARRVTAYKLISGAKKKR